MCNPLICKHTYVNTWPPDSKRTPYVQTYLVSRCLKSHCGRSGLGAHSPLPTRCLLCGFKSPRDQASQTQPPSSCLSGLRRLSQGSSQAAEDSQPLDRSSLPLAPSSLHLPEHPARSYGAGQRPGGQHVQNGRLGMVECWCEPSCVIVFKRTLTTLRLLGKPVGSGSGSAQVGDAKRLWVPSRG